MEKVNMETVTTASGIEFNTDMVSSIPFPPMLYIRVIESTLADIAAVFGNPEETKEIRYGEMFFSGYTLDALVNEGNAIRVNLRKEG